MPRSIPAPKAQPATSPQKKPAQTQRQATIKAKPKPQMLPGHIFKDFASI